MKAYLEILRPSNCLMGAAAVAIGVQASGAGLDAVKALVAMLVAFVLCGFGNAINDYFDYEIDRVNRPLRPIPSGRISLRGAYLYAVLLVVLGNLLAVSLGVAAFSLAVFNSALLYFYAGRIKRGGGLGKNLIVSYLVASPFLFGGVAAGNPHPSLLLTALAALANTGREIAKDIEDMRGDSSRARTLPVRMGVKKSSGAVALFLAGAVALSPVPYLVGLLELLYLPAVALADLLFLSAIAELLKLDEALAGKVQRRIKLGMLLGLVAFLAGSYPYVP